MIKQWLACLVSVALACAMAVSACAEPAEEIAAPEKDETVYVICDALGAPERVIESAWLKNPSGADALKDVSSLENIEILTDGVSYEMQDEELVWATNGGDVRYRGDGTREAPLTLSVSYTLNGEPITPDALAGQSGRVTMTFDYACQLRETRTVNGEERELTAPFAVVTAAILDDAVFTNIDVTNGIVFDDGSRSYIAGYALPGLQDDLALSEEVLTLPQNVVVSADVTDFSLMATVTLATNEIFTELDGDDPKNMLDEDELRRVFSLLSDTPEKLLKASVKKSGSLEEIAESLRALADALPGLEKDAKSNSADASALSDDAQAASDSLRTLSMQGKSLSASADGLMESLLSGWSERLSLGVPLTADSYATVLGALDAPEAVNAKSELDAMAAMCRDAGALADAVTGAADASDTLNGEASALSDSSAALYEILRAQSETTTLVNNKILRDALSAFADNMEVYAESLREAADISAGYDTYAGRADIMDGQVRFIYRTADIGD